MSAKLSPKLNLVRVPIKKKEELKKPSMVRRFGAYAADWFLGDLSAAFPVAFLYSMVTQTPEVTAHITEIPGDYGILAGVLSMVFIIAYYVLVPWKLWPGQTVGKRIFGIRITGLDGKRADLKQLILRQVLGLLILENGLMTAGRYAGELAGFAAGQPLMPSWWKYAGWIIGTLSSILIVFHPLRRGIHDYLAGTRVVMAWDGPERKG